MEGKKVQIGRERYKVIREYFSSTYEMTYLLLEDRHHDLLVCKIDDQGNVSEVTTQQEMTMLELVFNEGEE